MNQFPQTVAAIQSIESFIMSINLDSMWSSVRNVNMHLVLEDLLMLMHDLIARTIISIPNIESLILKMLNNIFAPKLILGNIATITFLQLLIMYFRALKQGYKALLRMFTESGRHEELLIKNLAASKT